MKKLIIFPLLLLVITIYGCGQSSSADNSSTKEEVATMQSTANSSDATEGEQEAEESQAPTSREIDDAQPWQTDPARVKQFQDEGKVVFLITDAEQVENRLVEVSNVDANSEGFNESFTKEMMAEDIIELSKLYSEEVSEYIDNPEYFEKIEEARQAMINGEYDAVPELVSQAAELRTATE